MRINFTRMTSAKITNSEDKTTALVAERPTPSVPPCVRIPWKQATKPMIRPKTQVLNVGARKSLKFTPERPLLKNRCKEIGSARVSATHPARRRRNQLPVSGAGGPRCMPGCG